MQDGCRIFGSGKYGKMAKKYQHHKLPSCLGYPKHEGKDEENLTHFSRHYPYFICDYLDNSDVALPAAGEFLYPNLWTDLVADLVGMTNDTYLSSLRVFEA